MRRLVAAALLVLGALTAIPLSAAQSLPSTAAEQLHVTLSEKPGHAWIHWALVGPDPPASDGPVARWKVDGGSWHTTAGKVVGRLQDTGSGVQNAASVPTAIYAAEVGPIPPRALVTYQAGFATRGAAPEAAFRMPPNASQALRFLAYGDIGVDDTAPDGTKTPNRPAYPAFDIRDLAISMDPDLLIIPGDLAYSNSPGGWNRFMRFMEPLQRRIVTMPVMGNHEYDSGVGYHQFLAEYVLPNGGHQYTFQSGPVTFIGVNSDTICGKPQTAQAGTPRYPCGSGELSLNETSTQWLVEQLAAAQQDETPWTIVYFHHPALSWGRHGITWSVHLHWAPLFEQYGVDVVVTAHDHLYGRTYPTLGRRPVVNDTNAYVKGQAPVYLVLGGGGRDLYSMPSDPFPPWLAQGESVHNLGRFEVNGTTLSFQALRSDKSLLDEFSITAPRAAPGLPSPSEAPGPAVAALLLGLGALMAWRRRRPA